MSDEATRELPPTAGAPTATPPEDELALDDEWPARTPARVIRLAVPTAALAAVLLVAAGFWGGATLQKRHSNAGSGTSALASAFASGFRAAAASGATGATGGAGSFPAGRFGGFGGGSTAAATGTISVVDGDTLYVLTNDGSLVKVTLDPSTSVTRDASSNAVGLRPGDNVVVQGSTGSNGDVAASSVSATASEVSSGGRLGGFPGTGGNG
jgi:hypothetical protein